MSPPINNNSEYADFARISEADIRSVQGSVGDVDKGATNFPVQLHYMLAEMEKDGQKGVACWLSHGRAFMVNDKARFEKEMLPFWFRQTKFASFQRQLNTYGFVRITNGRDKGAYYHQLFLKGKQFLAAYIPRRKNAPKEKNTSGSTIDLYAYPPCNGASSGSTVNNMSLHGLLAAGHPSATMQPQTIVQQQQQQPVFQQQAILQQPMLQAQQPIVIQTVHPQQQQSLYAMQQQQQQMHTAGPLSAFSPRWVGQQQQHQIVFPQMVVSQQPHHQQQQVVFANPQYHQSPEVIYSHHHEPERQPLK